MIEVRIAGATTQLLQCFFETVLEGIAITWFEAPWPTEGGNRYTWCRRTCPTPLLSEQSKVVLFGVREFLEYDVIDVVQSDVAQSGRMTGARQAAT